MTYEQFSRDFVMMQDRLACQGIKIRKALLGPDEVIALSQYPGPMVKMSPTDPNYGKNEFMGIEWAPTKESGITFIHDLS